MAKKTLVATMACVLTGIVSSLATIVLTRGTQDAYAVAAYQDDTVKSKQFILMSHDGKLAAVLSTGKKDNLPCLVFVDRNEKVRMSLALTADGSPALGFTDKNEVSKIGLAVTKEGDAAFTLMNKGGDVVAALGVESNEGILLLNGNKKKE